MIILDLDISKYSFYKTTVYLIDVQSKYQLNAVI